MNIGFQMREGCQQGSMKLWLEGEAKSEVTGLAGLNLGNGIIVSSIDHQNVVNI